MSDLGKRPEVFHGKTKQRIYDDQRQFLGNYKIAVVKEEVLQIVIGGDLEDGLVSGPFSESELTGQYPEALLNSISVEIKDVTRTGVRTLVGEAQGASARKSGLQCDQSSLVLPTLCVFAKI